MTTLVCSTCGEVYKTRRWKPEMDEARCDCGGSRVSPSQARRTDQPPKPDAPSVARQLKSRKPMKRREPKRDWTDARAKVELEAACRYCRVEYARLEAAHVIGKKHDEPHPDGTKRLWVNPDRIIPLCPEHHRAYDAHQLDLLGYLSVEEQLRAVADCGSLEIARRRIAPGAYLEYAA